MNIFLHIHSQCVEMQVCMCACRCVLSQRLTLVAFPGTQGGHQQTLR